MDLAKKKVTVIGLGNSGLNAALLLHDVGALPRVTDAGDSPDIQKNLKALDARNIPYEIGRHTEDFIKGSELVVLSPGVEDSSPAVKWAIELNISIMGEMELGYRFCKGRIIAITGTNGKSTVTTLIGEMLKCGRKDTVVCGNIGNSLCGEIVRIKEDAWVVLEVSSFQLERTEKFKPHIAIILNIADDHMDRYNNLRDYFNEKLKIFRNQDRSDTLILNYDAENLRALKDKANTKVLFYSRIEKADGAYVREGNIFCSVSGRDKKICAISDIRLKGLYNIENVLAASLAASLAGVGEDSIRDAVRNFRGLPHRFETVDIIDGVEYIDDSKGTTVDSTCRALESCAKPVILIAGGKDKFSDYSLAKNIVKQKVRHLVLIGEAASNIKKALGEAAETHRANSMSEAVDISRSLAKEGDMVLLSPMCSSFDMFKSYKERGEVFKKTVNGIRDNARNINAGRS